MAKVSFRGVSKVFDGDVVALSDFHLEVEEGEFLVLVGPSGCGKSTTLRILAGLETPTEGRVFIGSEDVTGVRPQDRDIAMVFQNYALYPHMTVYDNMAFGLKMRKTPDDRIDRFVREAADILGLEPYLDRRPRALSGGQRQRVAVGRAIVRHPAAFLFDEPLSNLDAKLRVQMRSELSRIHQKLGTTMLYVTHDQAEAMTLGDRIVVLKDGVVQQVDTPLSLYDRPDNVFVAGFIGSPAMNFLGVELDSRGSASTDGGARVGTFPDAPGPGRMTLGVRPEDVDLEEDGPLPAEVEVVETLGNEKIVYMRTGDVELVARIEPDVRVSPGDSVRAALRIPRCHLFDPDTARRVGVGA
ncbi:MAG: sn-glycerol-3-phosphate ABC transporter ATP-binding protein UgpC [Candidatus Fermentibacteraceae bacterium]